MALNRLKAPASAQLAATTASWSPAESITPLEFDRLGADHEVATFTPKGYESGYAYPLIVWLHEDESSELELPQVMRHVSVQNFLAAAPRGASEDADGHACWRQTDAGVEAAEAAVFDAIETAGSLFSVHPDRVFIAGAGAGGTMAVRLGLRRPERFAAAVTLDGPLPRGGRPLARVNEARGLPLLLSAARHSRRYPEPRVCGDLALLHSAGFQIAVRQYPGDEGVTTAMLADLNRWLMELVCG